MVFRGALLAALLTAAQAKECPAAAAGVATPIPAPAGAAAAFSFTVVSDPHGGRNGGLAAVFAGIRESGGPGAFLVVLGDLDPASRVEPLLRREFGADFPWYPVVGNHDAESPAEMGRIRQLAMQPPGTEGRGPEPCPETTYTFDRGEAHFVVLNVYCSGDGETRTDGDISPELRWWLAEDLASSRAAWVFVFGHEPAFPAPDAHWGTARHVGDSLDKYPAHRDAFWALLARRRATAYLHGHVHTYSRVEHDGVWEVAAGLAQEAGKLDTFLRVAVEPGRVTFAAWRSLGTGRFRKVDEWTVSRPAP